MLPWGTPTGTGLPEEWASNPDLMVFVDAYIKFPEVVKMTNTTAKATVNTLRDIFSRHGLLVSDNAPQSASKEYETFFSKNGILHCTSAAYKPSPNGQAERVVQILKSAIKQAQLTNNDISAVTAQYLLVYGNTPHSTADEPPALPVMGRRPSTCLDLLILQLKNMLKLAGTLPRWIAPQREACVSSVQVIRF